MSAPTPARVVRVASTPDDARAATVWPPPHVSFDHRDPGTSEADWLAASRWDRVPALELDADRLIVLSAHPDDETLGAGGLIAVAHAAGIPVTVIVVTDGEAAAIGPTPVQDLGRIRRREVVAALHELAPGARIVFLAVPDGGIGEAQDAVGRRIASELATGAGPERLLLAAPWWGDGHPDHRALGEIARGFHSARVRTAGYPIWMWHWADPAEVRVEDWSALALSPPVRAAKERAVRRHASQMSEPPLLHDGMLAHFARDVEVFVTPIPTPTLRRTPAASAAASSVGATYFEGLYERHTDPWGFDDRWYEKRKRSILLSMLPRERFVRTLELGCATGALTAELRTRTDAVIAVDLSPRALARARDRLGADSSVQFLRAVLPAQWPDGTFDLVVLSELAYYWSSGDLDAAIARIDASLTADGALIACHWRHPIAGAPLTGDAVHERLSEARGFTRLARHIEPDVVVDVFARTGTASVARAEGLTP